MPVPTEAVGLADSALPPCCGCLLAVPQERVEAGLHGRGVPVRGYLHWSIMNRTEWKTAHANRSACIKSTTEPRSGRPRSAPRPTRRRSRESP
jgi:hypothetical protein